MGIITPSNQIEFKSCKALFAQIKEDLDSFDALDLIDNRVMYKYVKKVISEIGIGYYMEKQAVLPVTRYKTKLPEDFYLLYSVYKIKSEPSSIVNKPQFQGGNVMYLENTCEKIVHCKCDIEKVVDKVTVKTYIDEGQLVNNFTNPTLLRIVAGNGDNFCDPESPNRYHNSGDEINISKGYINTNFSEGNIYIKYYGFPFDDKGFPMIPDDEEMKTAIEDYIKYKLLEKWWTNNDVPNMQLADKMQKWEQNSKISLSDLKTKTKTPSFQTMLNYKNNNSSRFDVYQFYSV